MFQSEFCVPPAVDDHGSSICKLGLFSVDLSEEAQDATRLLGDAVVGPADVLVVPDDATVVRLRERKKTAGRSRSCGQTSGKSPRGRDGESYLLRGENFQNADFVICGFSF